MDALPALLARIHAALPRIIASEYAQLYLSSTFTLYRVLVVGSPCPAAGADTNHESMVASGAVSAACEPSNVPKCRYSNIMPFDAHRVVLRTSPRTDFINASHMVLPTLPTTRIIATQAPLHPDWHGPNTCGDFWRCVWENDVGVIVGLAKVQPGFSGSSLYWPTAAGSGSAKYDEFRVDLKEETNLSADVVRRDLDIVDTSTPEPHASRRVRHLHYSSWPNYSVPASTAGIRIILREVEQV